LGADSLSVIAILSQIYEDGWGLTAADFYSCSNIRELAAKASGCTVPDEDLIEIETPIIPVDEYETGSLTDTGPKALGDILLTGSTGFLGAHLLHELLTCTDSNIHCLVRAANQQEAADRLKATLEFYFGKESKLLLSDRVRVIRGDVSQPKFGLSNEHYKSLGRNVNTVIHSAALVKYFGPYEQIRQINVDGTQKVIDFCIRFNCFLGHVSTVSVTGNYLVEQNVTELFTERDFYIGQNYRGNIYVRSKFEGENRVLRAIRENKLKAAIFRMGNLTGRHSDGKFQNNMAESAFYSAVKEVVTSGAVSDKILTEELEFSPVDNSARAIILLLHSPMSEGRIYHLMNPKTIRLDRLISELSKLGIVIHPQASSEATAKDVNPKALSGASVYLMPGGELTYGAPIRITADYTVDTLKKLGFEWSEINAGYLSRIIEYMRERRFL